MRGTGRTTAAQAHSGGGRVLIENSDDAPMMQTIDVAGLSGERMTGIEHWMPFGLTSRVAPPEGRAGQRRGAESLILFGGGDRSNPVALPAADRRFRPRNLQVGEVAAHGRHQGQQVLFDKDGNVIIRVPAGKKVRLLIGDTEVAEFTETKMRIHHGDGKAQLLIVKGKCVQLKDKSRPALHYTVDLENNRLVQGSAPVTAPDPFPNE